MIQNEVLSAIAARRSCRAYLPEQIKPEELQAVVTAGTWAPTGMSRQSPVIVAVQDQATRDRLSAINASIWGVMATRSTARPPCWWSWRTAAFTPVWRMAPW